MDKIDKNTLKILTIFLVTLLVAHSLIKVIVHKISDINELNDKEAAYIIQQDMRERFDLFLELSLTVGQMSAGYLANNMNDYELLVKKNFAEREYLLGLNRLDASGKIVTTYPSQINEEAKGKITQNINFLKESYQRGENYWFSPPFELFQGSPGFVLYVPIIRKAKLSGWVAPVISSQRFFERFKDLAYFSTYELRIIDEKTSDLYFATALEPGEMKIHELKSKIRGRDIIFQGWRKTDKQFVGLAWYWYFIISFLVATLAALFTKFHLSRKQVVLQLRNISLLLRLTAKEALSNLVDIQSEYLSLGSTGYLRTSVVSKDVHSITNLIEQIDLLQTMAETKEMTEEECDLLPIIKEQIDDLADVTLKKELKITLDEESFIDKKVEGNRWLMGKTVIKNCLTHCLLYSLPSRELSISYYNVAGEIGIRFHMQEVHDNGANEAFKLERRLLVARNAMGMFKGTVQLEQDGVAGMVLKILFDQAQAD